MAENSSEYVTLKAAAATFGTGLPRMSRLVRRLGVPVYANPRDRRSKLIRKSDLDSALNSLSPLDDGSRRPAHGTPRRRQNRQALEEMDQFRAELEIDLQARGVRLIPTSRALALVRGEIELDHLS